MTKPELRARARALRAQGKSYNEIVAELGVSKSSCSLWLRDMPRPIDEQEQVRRSVTARRPGYEAHHARTDALRLETKTRAAQEVGALTDHDILLAGAMIYWCEGGKNKPNRRRDRVDFMNSDPALIGLFLRFLDVIGVRRDRLRFTLQIHESTPFAEAQDYWEHITGARSSQFYKPTIKPADPATKQKNLGRGYRGCLRVTLQTGAEVYQRIEGLIIGLADQIDGGAGGVAAPVTRLRDLAVELRRAGISRSLIQDRLGIGSKETVDGLLRGEPPAAAWLGRVSYDAVLEDRAREFRAQGWGSRRIAEHLGCSRATVRGWLNPTPMDSGHAGTTDGLRGYWARFRACEEVSRQIRVEAAAGEVGGLDERQIRFLGAVAYWCEGGKDKSYGRRESVVFMNSDPELIRFFLRFLSASGVDHRDVRCRLHIHQSGDASRARMFWTRSTGLRTEAFHSDVIKRHIPKTRYPDVQPDYNGCLDVRVVRSAELYRVIEGWALGALLGVETAVRRWSEVPQG